MSNDISLDEMTVAEKLALMERIWADLSPTPDNIASPAWHGEVLAERQRAVAEGRSKFVPWEEAKQRFQDRSKR